MIIFTTFLDLISYLITLEPFIYLGVFSVFIGLIVLILRLAGGE